MNEECFAKEMKKIQSVVSRALQKANALTALADGGKMSREKLQLTLEETAYFFESATLYLRALCETQMPGVGGYGRRDGLEFQLPSGHIEIAGAGWVHMQLDSCHFEQGIQKIFVISREIRMQRNGCDCYKQVRKNILPQFFFFVVFDIVIFHVAVIFSKARRIACVSPFSRCMNTSRSDLVVEKPKVPKFSA